MHHDSGYIGSLLSLCGLLSLAIVGLPAFAIHFRRSGRQPSERIQRLGGSRLMGIYILEYGYWLAHLPLRVVRRLQLTPDVVTMAGLLLVLVATPLLATGWFALGGWVFLVGCIFDVVDGMLARETGRCSDAGEYLDAIVDRYSEILILGGLCFYYRDRPWALAVALAALLGSVMVSYNRAKAEALGVHDAPGWLMRRHERGVYIGFGAALAPVLGEFIEQGAVHPIYHLELAALTAVALLANIAALKLFIDVRRRLRTVPEGVDVAACAPAPAQAEKE